MDDFSTLLAVRRASEPEQHPRPVLWVLIFGVMILLVLAVAFLGPETPPEPAPTTSATPEREARTYTVTYRYGVFSPTNLRIHVGDTVRFRNESNGAIRIVADPIAGSRTPEFDSIGGIQPDSYFSYTFARVGTFGYHNEEDPNQAGVIIVRE